MPITADTVDALVYLKRFHEAYPNMPVLYHTYCSECPGWGTCEERARAEHDVRMHEHEHASKRVFAGHSGRTA